MQSSFQGVPVEMEYFHGQDPDSSSMLQIPAEVRVHVGIIGFRYGSRIPDNPERSYVELEYYTAKDKGLKLIVFMLDPSQGYQHTGQENCMMILMKMARSEHVKLSRVSQNMMCLLGRCRPQKNLRRS